MSYFIYQQIYKLPIRTIIGYMLSLFIIWRLWGNYVQLNLDKQKFWRIFNCLIMITIIGGIVIATVSSRSGSGTELILRPFYSFVEAKIQPERYRSMLMNIFLFFPLGLSLPYALPGKWRHKRETAIIFAMVLSVSIEAIQYFCQLGRAEIDDVICNTLGCLVGCFSYVETSISKRTSTTKE